jgi:hypothetical protein
LGATRFQPTTLADLRRRELFRVADQIAGELGLDFSETKTGMRISGTYVRTVEITSGRFALIERTRDFTLVPWRPEMDRQLGKPIDGIIRSGGTSWTFQRGRSGPIL